MNEIIKTVYEDDDALVIKLPACGVDIEDVEVDVIDNFVVMTVPETEVSDAYIITEEVDFFPDYEDIDLEMDNGVLSVIVYYPMEGYDEDEEEFMQFTSNKVYSAMQFTGDNLDEVIYFITELELEIPAEYLSMTIEEGDWLVDDDGILTVYTDEEFSLMFL